jgi:DNA-binding NarL/FixJ family response regulator
MCDSKTRVVVIDKHQPLLQAITHYLQHNKTMQVVGATVDLEEGFSLIAQHQPDVVIIDPFAFDLNGRGNLVSYVRETAPAIVVIIMSSFEIPLHTQLDLCSGANAYIMKTVLYENLIPTINRCVQPAIES